MPTLPSLNTNPALRSLPLVYRCQIGDDVFLMGDERLIKASVKLGESQRSSTCRFTIYDPDQKFAQHSKPLTKRVFPSKIIHLKLQIGTTVVTLISVCI
ncbi:MAG: hypothetical protein F6K42_01105 [Leptolyngbya sp. SIO1D8]|nr:hypothetical protein [Leptolyngbya sp. SIO1D8]